MRALRSRESLDEIIQELSGWDGAGTRIRTTDFLITNEALYQLSYTGTAAHSLDAWGRAEKA